MNLEQKSQKLNKLISDMRSVAVAFSGGVDSTLVLKVAHDVLGEEAIALTAVSPSLPKKDLLETREIASRINVRHKLIKSTEFENPNYLKNSPQRCYFCKSDVYSRFERFAAKACINVVVDGTNYDDRGDFRPGRKAASKHNIRSPLLETELTKSEIRELARRLNLPNWDKPSAACLSSRIPYGSLITIKVLSQVEKAEQLLHDLGIKQCRVRHHGDTARIEVNPLDFEVIYANREKIREYFRNLGFNNTVLDLAGYRSGSLNTSVIEDVQR
jgi:uncharacterized protein